MKQSLNEDSVEYAFIDQLKELGYLYHHGSEIAPKSEYSEREDLSTVLLENQLEAALIKLNPGVSMVGITEALGKIKSLGSNDIMTNNEAFHKMLTNGIEVVVFEGGKSRGVLINLIDFETPENNSFWAVNQFVIKENKNSKRYDVVLFINGIPLVFVELKSAIDEKATLEKAFTQIQNYKEATPSIFYYNALCIISDGIDARTSTVSAPFSRYLAWKSPVKDENGVLTELDILTKEMLKKDVLLSLVRFNTVFESEETKDEKTGVLSLVKIKKVAAYHQYYLVEKAVKETLRATGENGDRKIGVAWHTQGSGKSLSMVFYTGKLVVQPQMKNPTIVVLTDRNDLDDQLFGTFGNCTSLLRQTPTQAENRTHLQEILKVSGGGIVFTTIQKFSEATGVLSERENIVVMADEAHRSQYGFKGKINQDTGHLKYGSAKYLRDALPNASFIGFTGTPIEHNDKDTKKVFGDYIDIYDIAQAVKDGATVPLSYESRLVKIKMDDETAEAIDSQIDDIEGASEAQIEKAKKYNAQINAVVGHPDRVKDVALDIVTHFENRQEVFEGKGMIVCMTRQIAVDLYNQIKLLRPDWHNDDLKKGSIKVVMTSDSSDPKDFQPHHTSKQDRKDLATRIKDVHDELNLVIVQSMWLTGFDAPTLHTLYVDKKMKGAGLMQAIARVNRVYKDKPGGLIVDYIGIGQDLREAMGVYTESGGQGEAVSKIEDVIKAMMTKFEVVHQMFHGFDYESYFTVSTKEKLQLILSTQNFILSKEKLEDRFVSETDKLSKLFSMASPSFESESIKDKVAFFQAIRARLKKYTAEGSKTDAQVNTAIKQIVDHALSSDGVIDVFEAAGIKAPSLNILSEEFLLQVRNMENKNIAFALLKKLLNDEVKVRKVKNVAQGKKFSEMLSGIVKKYHNNQIDTAQVLNELSEMAKEMKLDDKRAEELGLSPEEYAFYTVLSQNSSTTALADDKMKDLISLIVKIVRENATVDWNRRDDVRARLRLSVKKVLMRFGYPPDVAKMEAENVLEQSELLAEEFSV